MKPRYLSRKNPCVRKTNRFRFSGRPSRDYEYFRGRLGKVEYNVEEP